MIKHLLILFLLFACMTGFAKTTYIPTYYAQINIVGADGEYTPAELYGCRPAGIWRVLNGKRKTCRGYIWTYKDSNDKKNRNKQITIEDVTYTSVAEAARKLGKTRDQIGNILKNKKLSE